MVKIIVWGGGHGRQDDGRNGKKNLSVWYEDKDWDCMKWKRPIGENTAETLYVIDFTLFTKVTLSILILAIMRHADKVLHISQLYWIVQCVRFLLLYTVSHCKSTPNESFWDYYQCSTKKYGTNHENRQIANITF